jgi:xanthine dehydrogenase accessory factor
MVSILQTVYELEKNNEPGALCTIIRTSGSTPRHEGSKMVVYPNGQIRGTVGGGEIENRVRLEALEAIKDGKTRFLSYRMVDPSQGDPGVCGGTIEVYVEPILPRPTLVLVGAGHVGKEVAHLAKRLGFFVLVSDDRAEFCSQEENPEADQIVFAPMAEIPDRIAITNSTYFVLTTRGSNVDIQGLPAILNANPAYIGIIGSKRRWMATRKALLESGVPETDLVKIHSPIGLELHAETPEEIAVSIMAEIIMVRNGGTGKTMKL